MQRRIQAHEATIRTASVDVRTLTISGKQVTLSVFRQLIDEDVIDPDTGELRGEPWGTVNYFWKDCHGWSLMDHQENRSHLHVVWQLGNELRRAAVRKRPSLWSGRMGDLHTSQAVNRLALWRLTQDNRFALTTVDGSRLFSLFGFVFTSHEFPRWVHDHSTYPVIDEAMRPFLTSPEEVTRELTATAQEMSALEAAWRRSYGQCADLDQLFIAV